MDEGNKFKNVKKYFLNIYGFIAAILLGGGVLSVVISILLGQHLEAKKVKTGIYIETKSICDQLNDEYKELIKAKIEKKFFRTAMLRSSIGSACIPLDKPPTERIPLDQYLLKINAGREKLLRKLNEIELHFDIDKEMKKEMIHLRVSNFSDTLAIQKVRLKEKEDCDELRSWRDNALQHGKVYLEKWFSTPCSKLLNKAKKQL